MNINIQNKNHFQDTINFAKKLGGRAKRSLIDTIKTLNRIKRAREATEVILAPDFVSHSFQFAVRKDSERIINGGIILHGFQETFSVELNPEKGPHWSMHT